MLIMTVLIALSVLIPMGFSFSRMMLRGMGLIHHTLCPIISVSSYFLWEKHSSVWYLPVAVTFLYGLVMLCLNYKEVVDGPYPFLRIRNQSKAATFAWMTGLLLFITILSLAVTASTNPTARLALDQLSKLKGSELHSTVVLSHVDAKTLKKLGINVTCEPKKSV
jgi:hypothetical protein